MRTRSGARSAPWADLPPQLWEQIAGLLPIKDVMALHQAWLGGSHLAETRVRAAAAEKLKAEFCHCLLMIRGCAVSTATEAVEHLMEEAGIDEDGMMGHGPEVLAFLNGWLTGGMEGALGGARAARCLHEKRLRAGCSGVRCTFEWQPRGAGCAMQAVLCMSEPHYGGPQPVEVEVEELRFLTRDGSLLIEFGISHSLDNSRCSVRSVRLGEAAAGGATGFGRLQPRPLSEAAPHFQALAAAAPAQPLRAADGRWADSLLLPAIHAGVTQMYALQLS